MFIIVGMEAMVTDMDMGMDMDMDTDMVEIQDTTMNQNKLHNHFLKE